MRHRSLTEDDKQRICCWRYDDEYAIYDLPSYDVMSERKIGFLDPKNEKNYFAFLDGDALVGFVKLQEKDTEVFVGVGVDPALCGRHYGRGILEEAYRISKQLYPEKPLYLEVRTWNTRAVKCYESAGFCVDGEPYELTTPVGKGSFYRMVRE